MRSIFEGDLYDTVWVYIGYFEVREPVEGVEAVTTTAATTAIAVATTDSTAAASATT
jgi:hypothetical protein